MTYPEGGYFADAADDRTVPAINEVTRTMGYVPGADVTPTQSAFSATGEGSIEVDAVTPVQSGEVAAYLHALIAFNARREYVDDHIRAGREQVYNALIVLMQERQDQITGMTMAELAVFLEQEALDNNLAARLSAEAQDCLYETFDLMQEYAEDPEEIHWMIEYERRQRAESSGQPQPVGVATGVTSQERAGADPREQLSGQVLSFADTSAIISTSVPPGLMVRRGDNTAPTSGGNIPFGPAGTGTDDRPQHLTTTPGAYNLVYAGDPEAMEYARGIVEAVSFTPVTEPVYENIPKRFGEAYWVATEKKNAGGGPASSRV
jgi:hypothetical protein